jgi:hypothetical protein
VINLQTHHIHASLIRYVQSTPGAGLLVSSFPLPILSLSILCLCIFCLFICTPRASALILFDFEKHHVDARVSFVPARTLMRAEEEEDQGQTGRGNGVWRHAPAVR